MDPFVSLEHRFVMVLGKDVSFLRFKLKSYFSNRDCNDGSDEDVRYCGKIQ